MRGGQLRTTLLFFDLVNPLLYNGVSSILASKSAPTLYYLELKQPQLYTYWERF